MKRGANLRWLWAVLALQMSGCAIYTPFEVVRFWADYNSERMCNAQVEVFDHLPPKTARVRLMRWGYNIGPTNVPPKGTLGIGTGIWEERLMFWRKFGAKDCPTYPPENAAIAPTTSPTPISEPPADSIPVLPPPAPPAEEPGLEQGPPPQLGSEAVTRSLEPIQPMSFQGLPANSVIQAATRAPNTNWVFTKPPIAKDVGKTRSER
jgi:hypothetical protein